MPAENVVIPFIDPTRRPSEIKGADYMEKQKQAVVSSRRQEKPISASLLACREQIAVRLVVYTLNIKTRFCQHVF